MQLIAARVRATRLVQQLSVAELAKRSGVAKATLSRLEAGQGNPTLETLMALATHLGVSLTELLTDSDRPLVHVTRRNEGTQIGSAGLRLRLMHRTSTGTSLMEIFDMHMDRGIFESRAHAVGVHEDLILHSGELVVGPADATYRLVSGDFISFEGDRDHSYECVTETAHATLLVTYPSRSSTRG